MRKRKPIHPGEILRYHYLEPLGMTAQRAAEKMKISCCLLYQILNRQSRITQRTAIKLARVFKTTPDLWLNLQNQYDLYLVKKND